MEHKPDNTNAAEAAAQQPKPLGYKVGDRGQGRRCSIEVTSVNEEEGTALCTIFSQNNIPYWGPKERFRISDLTQLRRPQLKYPIEDWNETSLLASKEALKPAQCVPVLAGKGGMKSLNKERQ